MASALRLCLASVIIFAYRLWRKRKQTISRADEVLFACAGICLALHFAFWITSLQYTSVAISTLLVCTSPLWTAALGLATRGRKTQTVVFCLFCPRCGRSRSDCLCPAASGVDWLSAKYRPISLAGRWPGPGRRIGHRRLFDCRTPGQPHLQHQYNCPCAPTPGLRSALLSPSAAAASPGPAARCVGRAF